MNFWRHIPLDRNKVRDWRTPFLLGVTVGATVWSAGVLFSDSGSAAELIYRQELLPMQRELGVDSMLSKTIHSVIDHADTRLDSLARIGPMNIQRVTLTRSQYDSVATAADHARRAAGNDSVAFSALRVLAPSANEDALIAIAERMLGAERFVKIQERTAQDPSRAIRLVIEAAEEARNVRQARWLPVLFLLFRHIDLLIGGGDSPVTLTNRASDQPKGPQPVTRCGPFCLVNRDGGI